MNNKPPKITLREAAEMAVNVLEGLGYDPIDLQSALADLQSETGFERKEPDSLKAEPVKQEPVACQDSDDRRLLREIFMLCEATEEIEATNDFMRGRVFEAKGIRRGIGTWYLDTFCGRSYMGEPVIPAAPVGAEHFLKAIAALREGIATCRAEALEEAEEIAKTIGGSFADEFLAAIRGLK